MAEGCETLSTRLRRAFPRIGLVGFLNVVGLLPYWIFKPMMRAAEGVCFCILGGRLKRNAKETIDKAFGDKKTDEEKARIIKAAFGNFGQSLIEGIYCAKHRGFSDDKYEETGLAYIDEALSLGKGAVMVSAHFGNFPMMVQHFQRLGYQTSVIIRRPRDAKIAQYSYDIITKHGVKVIWSHPPRSCVKEAIKSLRANKLLFVFLDQHYGADARVDVEFFGKQATAGASPVIFAQRTSAAVIPVFPVRLADERHHVIVEKPVIIQECETFEKTCQVNVQKVIAVIERYVRQYPEMWAWMHRRWKD